MQTGTRLSVAPERPSIEAAPLTHALASGCAQLSAAGSVALKFLPRLRRRDGQPACLFDLCNGTVVFSGGCAMPGEDAAQLLQSLLGDGYPVRALLVPERLAAETVRLILAQRRLRILHERRQRLFHAAAVPTLHGRVPGTARRAGQADLDRLAALAAADAPWCESPDAQAWRRSDAAYRARAVAEGRCYLWELSDVVSSAMVGPAGPDSYEIVNVGTVPEARRHGFASALLAHLAASMAPCLPIIFVERENMPAQALYLSLGFRPGGWWRCVLFDLV